ncbi:MAG: DUF4118 domain-containing protein [Corynebacterium provencense]|uniref:ATP-binding protein n=1 Tax=Corynebacterium provencense TaxID=1737425 RepID=UPI002989DD08|nr:DUF4118 domain-containing protein [Corynebacterium provencense]
MTGRAATGRGRLRVLLGAAPGVGKTFTMLEEGHRLRSEGRDVVVGVVETHGRAGTARMAAGLPVVPQAVVNHRGVILHEMDLPALLERSPDIALVDELAHTNAPGAVNSKRWEDVRDLLEAGTDVISTVNIQHIESLNDVVEQITGVSQQETVPDSFLRGADQIEVVDLAPQALRDRLGDGLIYPAERIDAALANYFRLGNLTALRELALLWLADEVDQALTTYRREHGIDSPWEARERVVVALAGDAEGELLLRRGARIAARSGSGELLAVHVTSQDGLHTVDHQALAGQRVLVDKLGGTYHQVVGEDVPATLVDVARSLNATQLVLGVSRRSRLTTALTGPGIGATVIRESGDIDVHIVPHTRTGRRFPSFLLPRTGGALSRKRRLLGFLLAAAGGPALTAFLVAFRSPESVTSDVLSYQLLVVLVSLTGGIWPALAAAVFSGVALDYFFISPLYTVTVDDPLHIVALVLYSTIAVLVSLVVDRAARRSRAARRAAAESELLQTIAGSVLRGGDAVRALVDRAAEAFGLDCVRVVQEGRTVASSGTPSVDGEWSVIPLTGEGRLEFHGTGVTVSDRRLLSVVAAQVSVALEHRRLTATAEEIEPIAASDRVRGALLSALSHDVRRPLAAAATAVGGLRSGGAALSPADERELLDTASESLDALASLVNDLLDVSRVQAGALTITTMPTDPSEAVAPALDELGLGPDEVRLCLGHGDRTAEADPVLLQRVLVNLLSNAVRHSPPGVPVTVTSSTFGEVLEIRVIDHGEGVDPARLDDIFLPFQRLGDTDNTSGLGLGLALSRGFTEALHGTLLPESTPGGGLTMVVSLPLSRDPREGVS